MRRKQVGRPQTLVERKKSAGSDRCPRRQGEASIGPHAWRLVSWIHRAELAGLQGSTTFRWPSWTCYVGAHKFSLFARGRTTSGKRDGARFALLEGIPLERSTTSKQYPLASALEERLKLLAFEAGDATPRPFRVDLVRVQGGKPPFYSVVIRSSAKASLREIVEQLLNRKLTCGLNSFMLKAEEAERIMSDPSG